ncbi:Rgp1-domain-containing protein [Xylariales sp. PMI_506]|nr:Rgp1-domain-containing protein [Xylariales sp. PMI_506]
MSADLPSNIRVYIHWHDQTIFAGEDIKCRITFKNVARPSNQPSHLDRSRQPSPLLGTPRKPNSRSNGLTPPVSSRGRGHRTTLSLNVPAGHSRSKSSSTVQWIPPQPQPPTRPGHTHQRSLSIVSLGSTATVEEQPQNSVKTPLPQQQRSKRRHGRSASLQISPRAAGASNGPQSAMFPPTRSQGNSLQSSPLFNNHSFPPLRQAYGRPGAASTMPNTPALAARSPRRSPMQMPDWKFPIVRSPLSDAGAMSPGEYHETDYINSPSPSPGGVVDPPISLPIRSKESIPSITEHPPPLPAARILSSTSLAEGTPRSSGDFYSLSNNSSETLASEYVTQPARNGLRPPHFRRSSGLAPSLAQAKLPEALMMGYAQVQGSFVLDGSLVNLGPFEAVKRKAVLGGQGGGVIGLETSKRDSGLLRNLGWGSWGNSIGELLGGGELSSIKDMRGTASSKSIPLLSTPQSILFVDLQLAPGESKTYEYSFKLPKGLPPSHRGRAMKISYCLVIGTQRPGGSKEQKVKSVEIPFRVLGSVNSYGEILGHDLMSPYVVLRDLAKVHPYEKTTDIIDQRKNKPAETASTLHSFLAYVDELLERPRNGTGLLSPTAHGPSSRRPSTYEEAATAREAIDLAILRSNMSTSEAGQSTNRFEIARNGQRVGAVMLARPSYRLGETVTMVIDFTDADIPCYAVHAVLETAERVEPALALRSEASVHRVTRKVYGSASEATMFARRIVFNPTIPINATPEFVTSGVSLEWKIRIEFVVQSSASDSPENLQSEGGAAGNGGESSSDKRGELLEEIARDDRGGLVLVAAESLDCESFEVAVPLRVYGAVCNGLERLERDDAEEGLAV